MKILTKLLLSSLVTSGLTAGVIGITTLLMNQRQDHMNALHDRVELAVWATNQMQIALSRELFASYDATVLGPDQVRTEHQSAKAQVFQALEVLQRTHPTDSDLAVIQRSYQELSQLLNLGTTALSAQEVRRRYTTIQRLRHELTVAITNLSDRMAMDLQTSHQRAVDFEENSQVMTQIVGFMVLAIFLAQFLLILAPIIRSIQVLQTGATVIGMGSLNYQLTLKTGDEIEQLGQEFNRMAARLAELYQNLEAKVDERTVELNQVNQNLATEIAERAVMETALRQAEAENRALLEALPDLLLRLSRDGTYLDCVQAGDVTTLKRGETLVGDSIYQVMSPELAEQRMTLVQQALETGETQIYEYQIMVDSQVQDEEARIVRSGPDEVLVIVRDISDRKRTERHLHLQHLTAQILAESMTPDGAIARLLEAICTSLGWTLAEFWALDPLQQTLRCQTTWCQSGQQQPSEAMLEFQARTQHYTFTQGRGLPGRVWQQQTPIWIPDLEADLTFQRGSLAVPAELHSALGLPIVSESQVLGVVVLLSQQPQQPDLGLLTLMATIGSQIGQFLERHQVAAEVQRQTQRAQLLATITLRIRQSLSLEKILKTTVAEVRQFLATDRVVIYRFLPDWQGEVAVESVGEDWMPIAGLNIQDTCFQTSHVALYQKGRIRVIPDIYKADLNACHVTLLEQLQVRANLVVPVFVRGQLWGLMIVHHCQGPRPWQADEVQLLEQLSVQVAIALQQAELHGQVRSELQERRQAEVALRESESRLRQQATQLEQALADLKQLQTQLIQSEKMSSLGQLVGGIAHEINNPVSFVHVNLNYVQEYANDLMELLQRYQVECPQPSSELQALVAEKDLVFLMQDFPKILQSMQTGTERIRDIVRSLRNFSRLDEAELKTVDLHEGLNSTLMLLSQRLIAQFQRPAIAVVRQYADNLPPVRCYAGQLNQVFMNILSNAIDALDSDYDPCRAPSPTLTIETVVGEAGNVVVRLTDNGPGIPAEVKPRIFDPFFTTKPVGAGTGMGLAVSYQIVVERHRGQLTCLSQPGTGTTFVITIPTQQTEPPNARTNSATTSQPLKTLAPTAAVLLEQN